MNTALICCSAVTSQGMTAREDSPWLGSGLPKRGSVMVLRVSQGTERLFL